MVENSARLIKCVIADFIQAKAVLEFSSRRRIFLAVILFCCLFWPVWSPDNYSEPINDMVGPDVFV